MEHLDKSSGIEILQVVEYQYFPLRDRFFHCFFFFLSAAAIVAFVWYRSQNFLFTVVMTVLFFWSLRCLIFPTDCRISSDGIRITTLGRTSLFFWNKIHAFQRTRYGIRLFMARSQFPLQVFGTPFLPVSDVKKEDVSFLFGEIIPERELY
ncbi:MAG: hypothetical protein LBQ54_15945 [Planctomycetaceae bacterium]|jgi:hypothetical protein|nr:hypothetical protein [Planctomycetaceae bacterium]